MKTVPSRARTTNRGRRRRSGRGVLAALTPSSCSLAFVAHDSHRLQLPMVRLSVLGRGMLSEVPRGTLSCPLAVLFAVQVWREADNARCQNRRTRLVRGL